MTRTPESAARATEILTRYNRGGWSYAKLAVLYRLSPERVRQIIKAEERRLKREAWLQDNPPEEPPPKPLRPAPLIYGNTVDARIWTAMQNMECRTLQELAAYSDRELLDWPNFGMKSLKRLRELAGYEQMEAN